MNALRVLWRAIVREVPWWYSLTAVLVLYSGISVTVYRFRHPELTETQLFMALPDAWMWRR